jgi:hypothetical protein
MIYFVDTLLWYCALSTMITVLLLQLLSISSKCYTIFTINHAKESLLVFPEFTVYNTSPVLAKAHIILIPSSRMLFVTRFCFPLWIQPLLRWSVNLMTLSSMLMIFFPECRILIISEAAYCRWSLAEGWLCAGLSALMILYVALSSSHILTKRRPTYSKMTLLVDHWLNLSEIQWMISVL